MSPSSRTFLVVLGFELGLGAVALAAGVLAGVNLIDTFTGKPRSVVWGIAATLPLAALFFLFERSSWAPLARIRHFLEEFVRPLFRDFSLLQIALVAAAAGLGEELLFRGFLQNWISDASGSPAGGLIAASLLFGGAHFVTPGYAVITTGIGLYLGQVYQTTNDLLVPALAHGLYDFIALVKFLRFPNSVTNNKKI